MAKQNKSDLVGSLINKRKLVESPEKHSEEPVEDLAQNKGKGGEGEGSPRKRTKKPAVKSKDVAKGELGKVDSILGELKSQDRKQDKYSSIKIKTEVYNRIKRIARQEGIDRHGHLITKVLTDFCDRYDGK